MPQDSMDRLISATSHGSDTLGPELLETQDTTPVVLLVDDDDLVREAHRDFLARHGMRVVGASNGMEALAVLVHPQSAFDVVVTDIIMPGMDGIALLREIRRHNMDIPVILVTGNPQLDSAIAAVNLGGYRYVTKPIATDELVESVKSAVSLHHLARLKREALEVVHAQRRLLGDRASLEVHFADAMDGLWVAFQPIVDWSGKRLFGYEALVRTSSSIIASPIALLDAAERLGRIHDVGQRVRALVAAAVKDAPHDALLFVNLHAADLEDSDLFAPQAPLSATAKRTVLEITERASLEGVSDIGAKIGALRELGYRIAVDDLGAGYAGLASFTKLQPEVVKLDMSLIRGIDGSKPQQSIVRSMISVCGRELGVEVVCEGVETIAERDMLEGLGATLLQGYLFGRPARHFETMIDGIIEEQVPPSQAHAG